MAPWWETKETFDFFNKFLEECIIHNNTLLLKKPEEIMTTEKINDCVSKIKGGDSNESRENKIIHGHAIWFWSFADHNVRNKVEVDIPNDELNTEYINKTTGIGGCGQFYKSTKADEIISLLENWSSLKELIKEKQCTNVDELKQMIIEYINSKKLRPTVPMKNILLHLCDPNKYEPIVSQQDKVNIVNAFSSLIDNRSESVDDKLLKIRGELKKYVDKNSGYKNAEFTFYDDGIKEMWNFSPDESISDIDSMPPIESFLDYKKALILYGPPGTGKTYSAETIAKRMFSLSYLKNKDESKGTLKDFLEKRPELFKKRIKIYQMHANTSYDDFVAGIKLKNGMSEEKQGLIFSIINEANTDTKYPFVLILDEINRTDISRVFGEVFSAMEYRGKSYATSIGGFDLTIPDNLYFIGTMNEIDFSLEHVDFALRRRFIWQFKGFDRDALDKIIREKLIVDRDVKDVDISSFEDHCEALNKVIQEEKTLGKSYEIGHTFFAGISDIYLKTKESFKNNLWNRSVRILWNISIKPTLDAYCGASSDDNKNEFVERCKKAYLGES